MKSIHRSCMSVVVLVAVASGCWSIHKAVAACSLSFGNAITEWNTNGAGSFGLAQTPAPVVRVEYTSASQTPWTLYGAPTAANSYNLATANCVPTTHTISASGPGNVAFTITGSLDDVNLDGSYQLSCWDGSFWACSGSHDVAILKP